MNPNLPLRFLSSARLALFAIFRESGVRIVGYFCLVALSSGLALASDGFPTEGVYAGALTKTDGSQTRLLISLSYTNQQEDAPGDEMWPV